MSNPPEHFLYEDDDGTPIVTHSMLKTMRRCPRQTLYKYRDRLKPRSISVPLKRGTWIHALLEEHYKGGDWKEVHKELSNHFYALFEEEREKLGDLPNEIYTLMTSYFWHYRDDQDWEVVEVEIKVETKLPDGSIYRLRLDLLVKTPWGLYIVDHKSHKKLPDFSDRLRDSQSAMYLWALRKEGYDVKGFMWNYLRTNAPTQLKFKLDGGLYARQGETDYPTAYRSLIKQGYDPKEWKDLLLPLMRHRYVHGGAQLSPFFRRDTLNKDDEMLDRSMSEYLHTVKRMRSYDFEDRDAVERVVDRSCNWMCSYKDLCVTELVGGNADMIRRKMFRTGDPLDYYQDQKEFVEGN